MLPSRKAYVTLAVRDTYAVGCLILGHALRKLNTKHALVVMITDDLSSDMRNFLSKVYDEVVRVPVVDGGDKRINRPDLSSSLTKIECWNLTKYSKCVFLDCDTMVLQNCDELFNFEELSAASDVGWPDCFNSGVFVYKPSNSTYEALINLARAKGSFDGGEQGLLNSYFGKDWMASLNKRLSFVYNVVVGYIYTHSPAFKQFGSMTKIAHFIGHPKPWLAQWNFCNGNFTAQYIDPNTQHPFLQLWLEIFKEKVYSQLPQICQELVAYDNIHSVWNLLLASRQPELYRKTKALVPRDPCFETLAAYSIPLRTPPVYFEPPPPSYYFSKIVLPPFFPTSTPTYAPPPEHTPFFQALSPPPMEPYSLPKRLTFKPLTPSLAHISLTPPLTTTTPPTTTPTPPWMTPTPHPIRVTVNQFQNFPALPALKPESPKLSVPKMDMSKLPPSQLARVKGRILARLDEAVRHRAKLANIPPPLAEFDERNAEETAALTSIVHPGASRPSTRPRPLNFVSKPADSQQTPKPTLQVSPFAPFVSTHGQSASPPSPRSPEEEMTGFFSDFSGPLAIPEWSAESPPPPPPPPTPEITIPKTSTTASTLRRQSPQLAILQPPATGTFARFAERTQILTYTPIRVPITTPSPLISIISPPIPLEAPISTPVALRAPTTTIPLRAPISPIPLRAPITERALISPIPQRAPITTPIPQRAPITTSIPLRAPITTPISVGAEITSPIHRRAPIATPLALLHSRHLALTYSPVTSIMPVEAETESVLATFMDSAVPMLFPPSAFYPPESNGIGVDIAEIIDITSEQSLTSYPTIIEISELSSASLLAPTESLLPIITTESSGEVIAELIVPAVEEPPIFIDEAITTSVLAHIQPVPAIAAPPGTPSGAPSEEPSVAHSGPQTSFFSPPYRQSLHELQPPQYSEKVQVDFQSVSTSPIRSTSQVRRQTMSMLISPLAESGPSRTSRPSRRSDGQYRADDSTFALPPPEIKAPEQKATKRSSCKRKGTCISKKSMTVTPKHSSASTEPAHLDTETRTDALENIKEKLDILVTERTADDEDESDDELEMWEHEEEEFFDARDDLVGLNETQVPGTPDAASQDVSTPLREQATSPTDLPGSRMNDFTGMREWESGQIDYSGRDSSDNIIRRLDYLLENASNALQKKK